MRTLFFIAFFSIAPVINAQIVDTLKEVKGLKEGVNGSLKLGIEHHSGDSEWTLVSANAKLTWRLKNQLFLLISHGKYAEQSQKEFTKNHFEHARYRVTLTPNWHFEAFFQNASNPFKRLEQRILVGCGPRFETIPYQNLFIAVGIGAMFESEHLTATEKNTATEQRNLRATNYIDLKFTFNDIVTLSNTLFYQPRFDQFDDYRLSTAAAMVIKASERIAFPITYSLTKDSTPPEGVKAVDSALITSVKLSF